MTVSLLLFAFAGFGVGFLFASFLFFHDGHFDALATWQTDPRLGAFTDDEHVTNACGEGVTFAVLKVDDVERSGVSFAVADNTNETLVGTASEHGDVANVELDVVDAFAGGQIKFNGIKGFDVGVGVADGTAVVGDNVRDGAALASVTGVATSHSFAAFSDLFDAQKLELGFFVAESVKNVASLGVIQQTEVFVGLRDTDNILETGRVADVCAYFVVDRNHTAHADHHNFTTSQGVLEAVSEHQTQGQTFTKLVRTLRRTGGENATELVKHPMSGSI